MMLPDAKVEKVYLNPKPVDFRNPSTAWLRWSSWILKSQYLAPCFSFSSTSPATE